MGDYTEPTSGTHTRALPSSYNKNLASVEQTSSAEQQLETLSAEQWLLQKNRAMIQCFSKISQELVAIFFFYSSELSWELKNIPSPLDSCYLTLIFIILNYLYSDTFCGHLPIDLERKAFFRSPFKIIS